MYTCFDLHNHTVASGHAYSTIEEIAKRTKDRGFQLVGQRPLDHTARVIPPPILLRQSRADPKTNRWNGDPFGVEANIISTDGKLDLPESPLKELDFVAAGLLWGYRLRRQNQGRSCKGAPGALENPYVDFIVHPGQSQVSHR